MGITKIRISALAFGALAAGLAAASLWLLGDGAQLSQESTALLLGAVIGGTVTGLVSCAVRLCDDPAPTVPADVVSQLIAAGRSPPIPSSTDSQRPPGERADPDPNTQTGGPA